MCITYSQYIEKRQVQELCMLSWSSLRICALEEYGIALLKSLLIVRD